MPGIYEAYEIDRELLDKGVVFDVRTPEGDAIGRIRCLPADGDLNPGFRAASARALEELARAGGGETKAIDLTVRVYAESVFVDWDGDGWRDRDGSLLPFTVENCERVMRDLPALFKSLQRNAMQWTNFRKTYAETIAGK